MRPTLPFFRRFVAIASRGATVILPEYVSDRPSASETASVNRYVPANSGRPLRKPVARSRSRPSGRMPASVIVYGARPPDGRRVEANLTPTSVRAIRDSLSNAPAAAMASGSRTVMLSAFVSLVDASMTASTVNEYEPAVVGMPEMTPSLAPRVRPGGSAPALIDQAFASGRLAVMGSEYGAPTVPGEVASGPIVSFGLGGTPGLMGMTNRFSPTLPIQFSSPTGSAILT